MASQDRTEKATPQRLKEARKRGDIPNSPELTGAAIAVVSLFVFQGQAIAILNGLLAMLSRDLAGVAFAGSLSPDEIGGHIRNDVSAGLSLLLPLAMAIVVAAIAIGVANTRGVTSLKGATPSLRKLNLVQGVKHLASKETLITLIKTLAKLTLFTVIVILWLPTWQRLAPTWPLLPLQPAAGLLWQNALGMSMYVALVFVVVGIADAGYRYFSWQKRLRMTKEEVKEEMKRSEGNPQMRARIRQTGRKRLRALMAGNGLRRVPQADVVITNPTHFAIAIQYKSGVMRAPKVIAKGQRLVALRIKEAARQHNIPIVENKPLAQALYKSVAVGKEVPPELYQAVAQVLAFVYRLRNAGRRPQRVGSRR